MKSTSERAPSSGENSTSSVYCLACATAARAWPFTSSRVVCSFCSMWISLVAMKVWMRGRSASFTASRRRRCPALLVRASPQITGPSTSRAIACTASKSPGEVIGKPASMMSTPRRASWWAISSFSCLVQRDAGRLLAVAQRRVEDPYSVLVSSVSIWGHAVPIPLFSVPAFSESVCGCAAATRYSPRRGRRRSRRSRRNVTLDQDYTVSTTLPTFFRSAT